MRSCRQSSGFTPGHASVVQAPKALWLKAQCGPISRPDRGPVARLEAEIRSVTWDAVSLA